MAKTKRQESRLVTMINRDLYTTRYLRRERFIWSETLTNNDYITSTEHSAGVHHAKKGKWQLLKIECGQIVGTAAGLSDGWLMNGPLCVVVVVVVTAAAAAE